MLPNVQPPVAGALITPRPLVGEPITPKPITADNCPAGGDHQYEMWSAKRRCIKCGTTA